jgi:hypothetical protein
MTMQSNRYPITLGLALREICLVSRDIWSHYRADARLRAARRRDARIRERTYAPPSGFNEFDSFLWCAVVALGLFIAVVSLVDGWAALDAWLNVAVNWIHGLFAPASTAVAASTGVVLRSRGNAISNSSLAVQPKP